MKKRQYIIAAIQILCGIASFVAAYLIYNGYRVAGAILLFVVSVVMFAIFFYNLFWGFKNKHKSFDKNKKEWNYGGIIRIFLYLAVLIGIIVFACMY